MPFGGLPQSRRVEEGPSIDFRVTFNRFQRRAFKGFRLLGCIQYTHSRRRPSSELDIGHTDCCESYCCSTHCAQPRRSLAHLFCRCVKRPFKRADRQTASSLRSGIQYRIKASNYDMGLGCSLASQSHDEARCSNRKVVVRASQPRRFLTAPRTHTMNAVTYVPLVSSPVATNPSSPLFYEHFPLFSPIHTALFTFLQCAVSVCDCPSVRLFACACKRTSK